MKCIICKSTMTYQSPDPIRAMDTFSQYGVNFSYINYCDECDLYVCEEMSKKDNALCYDMIVGKYRIFSSAQNNFTKISEIMKWTCINPPSINLDFFKIDDVIVYKEIFSSQYINFDFSSKEKLLKKIKTLVAFS